VRLTTKFKRGITTGAFVLLFALLHGCSRESDQDLVSSAKAHLDKNNAEAAVIELKAALQKNPAQSEVRLLLGSTLLRQGEHAAAEVELRKAAEAPELAERAVPLLAQAMLALGQAPKVVEQFGKRSFNNAAAQASLQTALANAYAAGNQPEQAQRALGAALSADANYAPALLFGARQRASQGDVAGAMTTVDAVLARAADNADAWTLKAELALFGLRQPEVSEAAYRSALKADPKRLAARFGLISMLTRQSKIEAAGAEIAELKKLAPNHPQTRFYEAQQAYHKGDLTLARELTQQLMRLASKNANILQLAGAIEYRLGAWTRAEGYFVRATLAAPDSLVARRLLISTYHRSGQAKKALSALEAALSTAEDDPGLYPIAGEIYLQNGDVSRAEKFFSKALKADPSDAGRRAALAMLRVSNGRVAEGLNELSDIAVVDKSTLADLALISVYFRQNELDKALSAIDKLEKKQPDKPIHANLRGRVQLAKNDVAAARKSFERALEIDPGFFPAAASLARLDLADNKPEAAKKHFESLLVKNPKDVQALLALAKIAESNKAGKEELIGLLTRAVDADPTDPLPRHVLVSVLLRHYLTPQALVVAQNGVSVAPESLENLYLLGRVQQAAGDLNQAISTYSKLIALRPSAGSPYLRLAETHAANQNPDAARASLRRALETNPDYMEVQRALVALDLGSKRFADARKTALSVQKQRPNAADGYILEGDIANVQKDWATAASAYRAALQRKAMPNIATKLHAVLSSAGKASDAQAFVADWLKAQPSDTVLLLYLGEIALARKDLAAAERHYLAALQRNPGHALVLNNLAWVTSQLGKPGALDYAEKANNLAANQPDLMDTLANLLAENKDFTRAVELQNKALVLQPDNASFRLSLAKIYLKSGDRVKAKVELDSLAKLGEKFASQAEVATLLKSY
jgi:putative PEP-CTERM system TPR-repeat lipoprotein